MTDVSESGDGHGEGSAACKILQFGGGSVMVSCSIQRCPECQSGTGMRSSGLL